MYFNNSSPSFVGEFALVGGIIFSSFEIPSPPVAISSFLLSSCDGKKIPKTSHFVFSKIFFRRKKACLLI